MTEKAHLPLQHSSSEGRGEGSVILWHTNKASKCVWLKANKIASSDVKTISSLFISIFNYFSECDRKSRITLCLCLFCFCVASYAHGASCWSHLQLCAQKNLRMDFTPPLTYSPGSRRTARSTRPSTTSRRRYLTAAWGQWICLRFEGRVMTPCFLPLFSEPTSSQCLVATLWLSLTRVRTAGGWYKGTASAGWFQDLISPKCDPNGRLLCCCCFLKPHYFNFAAVTVSLLQADWMDKCTREFSFILFLPPTPPLFLLCVQTLGSKPQKKNIES